MQEMHSFERFVESNKDLSFDEIIQKTDREVRRIDARLFPGSGWRGVPKEQRDIVESYSDKLGRFLFFMRWGKEPRKVTPSELSLYRQVCEHLIEKGQSSKSISSVLE